MAFYTDYEEVVPFDTSVLITKSAVCNAVAAMFVAHAGCTLVKYATLGVASSATNYAEITYGGASVKFYDTNSGSMGSVSAYAASTGYGYAFGYASYISVTVKIRFYNVLTGFLTRCFNGANWYDCLTGVVLAKISNGTSANAISLAIPVSAGKIYCIDGLVDGGAYYISSAAYIGLYDTDGVKQMLNQEWLSPTSATKLDNRYKMNNCYISAAYQETGIVEVDSRYFYINASDAVAFELNS